MTGRKQVRKKEFFDFIKNYPRKLNICVINSEPSMISYNDFELSDTWSESVVGLIEENRKYFINSGILII